MGLARFLALMPLCINMFCNLITHTVRGFPFIRFWVCFFQLHWLSLYYKTWKTDILVVPCLGGKKTFPGNLKWIYWKITKTLLSQASLFTDMCRRNTVAPYAVWVCMKIFEVQNDSVPTCTRAVFQFSHLWNKFLGKRIKLPLQFCGLRHGRKAILYHALSRQWSCPL